MAIPFKYNRRSLFIRRVSNSMTVGAIAIVVGVFVAAMAIVEGLDSAIKDSSSPEHLILIGRGPDSGANSFITLDQLDALKFLPAIKRDGVGNPLVSPELTEQVFMPAGDTLDNLPIRGVLPVSTQTHEKVRIIAGRMFAPGLNEVIIGKLILNQYPGCSLGALGFSRVAIMTSFLAESSALAFAAGIIGVILALPVNGLSTKFNGGAVSAPTLAFNFHVTPVIVIQALVFAIVIGALGGWLPARQAMRVSVVNALRRESGMTIQ